jgi:hypothetical protein
MLEAQIEALRERIEAKRSFALQEAIRKRLTRRKLEVAAGILSFLSGTSVILLLVTVLPNVEVGIIAIVLSFGSSLLSLLVSNYFNERDLSALDDAAAEYRELLTEIDLMKLTPKKTEAESLSAFRRTIEKYNEACRKYDPMMLRLDRFSARIVDLCGEPMSGGRLK